MSWTTKGVAALLTAAITVPALPAQASQPDAPNAAPNAAHNAAPRLRVAFVGAPDTDRGRAFTQLLEQRFGTVQAFDRDGCEPARLQEHDVVVLDWPQGEGLGKWFQAPDKGGERRAPLGPREQWRTPVVLIGSAGLNLAASWAVAGGFG